MKNRIGLTGSSGSLGKILLKKNKKINIKCYRGDVRDRKKVFKWFKKNNFNIIIHLAAIVPIKTVNLNKKKAKQVNYFGTKNIVDACLETNVSWLFFSSTSHVYGSSLKKINENSKLAPISYYGQTKLFAEKYIRNQLQKSNTIYCIGRIFSTTNKNQKNNYLVPDLKKKIKKTKNKIILRNLNHYRDFISMKDITKIIFYLHKRQFKGVINIASGKSTYLKDIAIYISKYYKKNVEFKDNKKKTYLIADTRKLRRIYKKKIIQNLKELIF